MPILPMRIYGDDSYPVAFRQALPLDAPRARFTGFRPGRVILKKGTIRREGALPLPCDIALERDVAVRLRDGTTIYTDVYLPPEAGRYPALIAWSPYGKQFGGQWLDDVQDRAHVPLSHLSELQKFEAPDPAFWIPRGYAVANPDTRGAYKSEGHLVHWGRQLAEDGFDLVEWLAAQPWSTGKVGMAGNSYLAISQWFIAAEQPPHLTAIAPWEGWSDHFRDSGNKGGIPDPQFAESLAQTFAGLGMMEDRARMIVDNQTINDYWRDKIARVDRITIPAYVVASYTNGAHTQGTFNAYERLGSQEKWLRTHNTHEWTDFHDDRYGADLARFFDYYLKGEPNGWTDTPRTRLSVLNPGGADIIDRVEDAFPPTRVQNRKLFLDATGTLGADCPTEASTLKYSAIDGLVTFTMTFDEDLELVGHMKLKLWVEADGADDMELLVLVQKIGADGAIFDTVTARGWLRVSQRCLDEERSTPSKPRLLHISEELLGPGEVVPVEIPIWPMALAFRNGEGLKLTVSAHRQVPRPQIVFGRSVFSVPSQEMTFEPGATVPMMSLGGAPETSPSFAADQAVPIPASRNKGTHVLHVGSDRDSHLLVPLLRS